jgi:hypothetical protein
MPLLALTLLALTLPQAAPAAPPAQLPSALLQPAIDTLKTTVGLVHLEKWKAPNPVRDTTDQNLTSIRRDIDQNLPPLLADADAAPTSVTKTLPLLRNIDALYEVLLRVASTGEMAAPKPQLEALQQAVSALLDARRTLGDRIQSSAVGQEKQVADLQASLRARPVAVEPPPPVVTKPAPIVRKPKPKAKPKPATPAAAAKPANP